MTLIASAKDNELEAAIELLPRGLSQETKVGLAIWVEQSSKIQSGKLKGWIDIDTLAACFEEIRTTAEDITRAMNSQPARHVVPGLSKTE